jgi:uncharacterized membrane protein
VDIFLIVLRLFHIIGGIAWVGGTFTNVILVEPLIAAASQANKPFALRMMGNPRFGNVMALAATSTVLSGVALFWRDSGGLTLDWLRSGQGIAFSVGGLAGLIAAGIGMLVVGRIGDDIAALQTSNKSDPGEQFERLRRKMIRASRIDLVVMIVAVICMASARYLTFSV